MGHQPSHRPRAGQLRCSEGQRDVFPRSREGRPQAVEDGGIVSVPEGICTVCLESVEVPCLTLPPSHSPNPDRVEAPCLNLPLLTLTLNINQTN